MCVSIFSSCGKCEIFQLSTCLTSVVVFHLHVPICQNTSTHMQLHFFRDTETFSSFLEEIDIPGGCGGDAAEDISSGLKVVTELLSWGHGTKARSSHTHVVRLS